MSTNISHDDLKRLLRSINQLKNAGYHDKLWLVDRSPFDNDDEPLTIIEKDSVRYIEVLLRLCPRSEPFNTSGFRASLLIPIEFPLRPPKLRLITEIYHPNVGKEGFQFDFSNLNSFIFSFRSSLFTNFTGEWYVDIDNDISSSFERSDPLYRWTKSRRSSIAR